MRIRNLVLGIPLSFLIACSSGGNVGDSCTADSECGSFKCLRDKRRSSADSSCVDFPGSGTCSPSCSTHADCTKYGPTLKCALAQIDVACNPTGICLDDYMITCNPGPCREAPAN
jgi:hypothetical protein